MPSSHGSMKGWIRVLPIAAAYLLLGRLAMIPAIPPGFASPVFPSAGLAFAAVLLWGRLPALGVFLGSFLLNLYSTQRGGSLPLLEGLPLPLLIASGATLGALVPAELTRRLNPMPTELVEPRSILTTLLIAGPLGCLISPSIAVTGLVLGGAVPLEDTAITWWYWWAGDVLGVVVALPTMLVLFGEPRPLWRARATTVGLPLWLGAALAAGVFVRAAITDAERLAAEFHEQAAALCTSIGFSFDLYSQAVISVERFIAASDFVSPEEFSVFASDLAPHFGGLLGMSWNPQVPDSERAAFEAEFGREIQEIGPDGRPRPARQADHYLPVRYVQPLLGNEGAVGVDTASEPRRRQAMDLACRTDTTVMTAPLRLVQRPTGPDGVLMFHPVYDVSWSPPESERCARLRGFAVAIVDVERLVAEASRDYPRDEYRIAVSDVSEQGELPLLVAPPEAPNQHLLSLTLAHESPVAGRILRFTVEPTLAFLEAHDRRIHPVVLGVAVMVGGMLAGFLLTITGRAEQIGRLVEERTEELSAILENAAEAVIIVDEAGRVVRSNPAAEQLFGYAHGALQGRPIGALIPGFDQEPTGSTAAFELSGRDAQGHTLALEATLGQVQLGGRSLVVCMIRDVGPRKEVERMKNEFVSTVSHELRTPLTSIRGSLGLLRSGVMGELSPEARDLLELAERSSERLVRLVNDILDVDKLAFDGTPLQVNTVALLPLLEEAVAQNRAYAHSFTVTLRLDGSGLPPGLLVQADGPRLIQVVTNLVANAAKFSPTGAEVLVRAHPEGAWARVEVVDKGPGIPEEFRERIFQRFAQADSSDTRRRGGTGLGLAICRAIVSRMGGQIGYESQPGQGSTFWFTVPLRQG